MSFLPTIPFANGAAQNPASFPVPPTRADAQTAAPEKKPADLTALVTRAQAGDLEAQSELVRRYTIRISAFVRPIIAQPSAVEDVVQMIFIKLVRRLGRLRDPVTFESWLFALARNTALDFIRRRRHRLEPVSDDCNSVESPGAGSARAVHDIMEALEFALTRLGPKDRELVTLIVQGSSYRAAAERVGLSVGAVKLRLNRARPVLRMSIGEAIGVRSKGKAGFGPPLRCRAAA